MFEIEKRYVGEMVAHARQEAPNECCGILAGANGRVTKLYRTTNAEHSPYRYNVEPKELLQIWRETEDRGWEILAIYHSHTGTAARPSATDVRLAAWPDALYFIVSLAEGPEPVLRAFRIRDGQVTEEELRVVDG